MCLISHRISNVSTLPATPARAPGLSILLEITILAETHMSVRGKGFQVNLQGRSTFWCVPSLYQFLLLSTLLYVFVPLCLCHLLSFTD